LTNLEKQETSLSFVNEMPAKFRIHMIKYTNSQPPSVITEIAQ